MPSDDNPLPLTVNEYGHITVTLAEYGSGTISWNGTSQDADPYKFTPLADYLPDPARKLRELLPNLTALVACPVENCQNVNWKDCLYSIIIHLNDIHRWSREQIAQWGRTLDIDMKVRPQDKGESDGTDSPQAEAPVVQPNSKEWESVLGAINGATYSFVIWDDITSAGAS